MSCNPPRPHLSVGLAVLAALWLVLVTTPASHAQPAPEAAGSSFITPFPPNDLYKLQVYGDGYSEGLLQGLTELIRADDRVELPRKQRAITSLLKAEFEDDLKAEEQSRDPVHIAVVMMGLADRGPLRAIGVKATQFGNSVWKEQYGQRLDRLLKVLKRRNMAVYMVGLPPLRRQDANAEAEIVNESLVEKSFANGIRFIEVAESFVDENGAFTQFGPDVAGNREKLRDGDGVGFTQAGNRKLAALVAAEIKRDLVAARAERAVPLAGSEPEQKRINPEKASATGIAVRTAINKDVKDVRQPTGTSPAPSATTTAGQARPTGTGSGDQRAETSRIALRLPGANGREETVQVEIVRPAVSAAVIALLTRKETVDAVQQPFDLLADDVGDGISVSTMVTALPDGSANGRRRGPTTQAAYTSVWVKGERLAPKPGRADDFSWPRPEALPAAAVIPATATTPPAAPRGPVPAGRAQGTPRKSTP